MKVRHYLASHYRVGGVDIRKPHSIEILIDDNNIEIKFSEKQYEMFWIMHKIIDMEMRLNASYVQESQSK